jgi:hypothetical protein
MLAKLHFKLITKQFINYFEPVALFIFIPIELIIQFKFIQLINSIKLNLS